MTEFKKGDEVTTSQIFKILEAHPKLGHAWIATDENDPAYIPGNSFMVNLSDLQKVEVDAITENLCKGHNRAWCLQKGTEELHECPFDADINNYHGKECNCCKECEYQCSMDI